MSTPPTIGTITVHGIRYGSVSYSISLGSNWGGGGGQKGDEQHDSAPPLGDDANTPPPNPDPDKTAIEITLNINRPLTENEKKALEALSQAISRLTVIINSLPDNATITLANGDIVAGAEVKQLWGKMDFVINEKHTTYRNGTQNGEADYNNGDPIIRLNIDIVEGYNAWGAKGMNYLPVHELAHITAAGRKSNRNIWSSDSPPSQQAWDANEIQANDIARAITTFGGLPAFEEAEPGYNKPHPIVIVP